MRRAAPIICDVIVVGLLAASLAACSDGYGSGSSPTAPPSPIPVASALTAADGTLVTVSAGVIAPDGAAVKLCEAMTMSIPPQCVGEGLEVEGLDLSTVPGSSTDGGVTWAPHVTVTGTIQGGTLTGAVVAETSPSS